MGTPKDASYYNQTQFLGTFDARNKNMTLAKKQIPYLNHQVSDYERSDFRKEQSLPNIKQKSKSQNHNIDIKEMHRFEEQEVLTQVHAEPAGKLKAAIQYSQQIPKTDFKTLQKKMFKKVPDTLHDSRYSKDHLLEMAYNIRPFIKNAQEKSLQNLGTYIQKQQRTLQNKFTKHVSASKNNKTTRDRILNITQDLIDESVNTFDKDSTILAVSLISKSSINRNKSNINMGMKIQKNEGDRLILPMVKQLNEQSTVNLNDQTIFKVDVKYKQPPEQLSLKEQISNLKDVQKSRKDGGPLSPNKDSRNLDSPTLIINNQLENINSIYNKKDSKSGLQTSRNQP
ncbi:UNKNOWN [Stylonychia lemnae]|uniref:Uncharacterized protein n=1 Tax=Stylonychia lemnae TaxID=5949 RepID=A0A078A9A5_STYLE|nr:UNKNOWN [Stylonychia lemnae]|eukprot:CDW78157.1 UNKNOWN [Stylonychia lemnae]